MTSNFGSPNNLYPSMLPLSPPPTSPSVAIDAFMGALTTGVLKDVRIHPRPKLLILDHIQRDLKKLALVFPI
ncbi:hypothetical protein VNO80_18799 [Phaseolus coccineus]|uniref:Uncharacterized protein n=1 Tax=Phaseolus coccineus TaxID=3886 RepID=A0AAN9MJR7_PHACN